MDEYEEQMNKVHAADHGKYHRYHFLKRTLQLVVSVLALLSCFLCHSSSAFSLFPHSFEVYFSTFLFSFFTHTLERKYMFLICNGILAFLAKSSKPRISDVGTKTSTSSTNLITQTEASVVDEFDSDHYDHVPLETGEGEEAQDTWKNEVEGQAGQENESVAKEEDLEEEEEESDVSVIVVESDNELEEEEKFVAKQEEQEEVGVGAVGANEEGPSTEELNRKIEEFIRKMKEEIRIEAQQQEQLVAV